MGQKQERMQAGLRRPMNTLFVGRKLEIVDLAERLTDPLCRLLTLVGPGGVGKTRLAIQVAAQVQNHFPDGVSVVSLDDVSADADLATMVAEQVGIRLHGSAPVRQQVLDFLASRTLLLVFDNFEHFLDQRAFLRAILQAAEAVTVFVTSRETLNLRAEWRYPLRGLRVPTQEEQPSAPAAEAAQLFAKRATQVNPTFSLRDNWPSVVAICRAVDGMPLALELAAAWTRSLTCDSIAEEIRNSHRFLTATLDDVPSRHYSMQAVFQHTWRLLDPEERQVFQQLSVFRGGFLREAAEHVAGATLPVLTALVDKSLLSCNHGSSGERRYHIHELLRQFAAAKLADVPTAEVQVSERHATYYMRFLHNRLDDVLGARQRQAAREIEHELENVHTSWRHALANQMLQALHRVLPTFELFCQFQSRYLEAATIIEKSIEVVETAPNDRDRLLALLRIYQSWFCIRLGHLNKAQNAIEHSNRLFKALDEPLPYGHATDPDIAMAVIASIEGDYQGVAKLGMCARERSEVENHPWNRQVAEYVLARAALGEGRYEQAHQHARQADACTRETGDRWFRAYCLNELGNAARALDDLALARQHYQASYAIREEFDDPEGMAVALVHLGRIALRQEDHGEARQLFVRSSELYKDLNDRGGLAAALEGMGTAATGEDDITTAAAYYRQSLALSLEVRYVSLVLRLFINIGDLLVQAEHCEDGLELLAFVCNHPAADMASRQRAEEAMDRCSVTLAPDVASAASARGQQRDLDEFAVVLQQTLGTLESSVQPTHAPVDQSTAANQALIEPLTERELEVLHRLAQGLTNKEIAEELVLVEGTVKAHNHNIYQKLGVHNRTAAVARAMELALLAT